MASILRKLTGKILNGGKNVFNHPRTNPLVKHETFYVEMASWGPGCEVGETREAAQALFKNSSPKCFSLKHKK